MVLQASIPSILINFSPCTFNQNLHSLSKESIYWYRGYICVTNLIHQDFDFFYVFNGISLAQYIEHIKVLCPPLKKEGHIALHMSVGMSVGG